MSDPWDAYEFACPECRALDRFYENADGTKQCAACGYEEPSAAHAGRGGVRAPGTHHTQTTTIGALVGHRKG